MHISKQLARRIGILPPSMSKTRQDKERETKKINTVVKNLLKTQLNTKEKNDF